MDRRVGRVLMVIGIGHALVGIAIFREPLAAMLRDGLVNAIQPRLYSDGIEASFGRAAAFWFLLFSPVLFMVGQIANRGVERRDAQLLRIIGWNLLAVGVAGVIVMPISGFWSLIALAPFILSAARHAGAAPPAAA